MENEVTHDEPSRTKKPAGVNLSSLKVDAKAQEEGEWVDLPTLGEGVAVHTRSLHCRSYRRMLSRLSRKQTQRVIRGGDVDPVQNDIITARCFAETLIVQDDSGIAWRGLNDEAGNPIPYDKELVFEWLTDPSYRKVADAFAWAASEVGDAEKEWERELGED